MTARSLAHRLATAAVGAGLAVAIGTVLVNPPLVVALVLLLNAGVSIWWGIHVFVTRRPW